MDALSLMGMKRTVFLPVSCNERAHETDVCNPICNQSGFSCSDLAPMRIRQLQSACARSADVCDPNPGCLQVATDICNTYFCGGLRAYMRGQAHPEPRLSGRRGRKDAGLAGPDARSRSLNTDPMIFVRKGSRMKGRLPPMVASSNVYSCIFALK